VPLARAPRSPRERVEDAIRGALTGCGFDEAVTFSLVADTLAAPLAPGPAAPPIRVDHSSRKRENALRQSIVPSLLVARRHNEAHGNADAELFEIAQVYRPRTGQALPDEPALVGLVSGRDYAGLKGVIESLLGRLHAERDLEVRPVALDLFTPGRSAELLLNGTHLGYLGEVDRARLDAIELRGACSAAELLLDVLIARADLVPQYRPLPPFPAVSRDLSLVVPRALPWSDLSSAVTKAAGATLEEVVYLDSFQGGNVPDGKQSLHFGLKFRHPERTLTGDEVERAVKAIIDACTARFDAELRA
jgi:phenylalanyl-tRNA synthetase beta chain